MLQPVATLDRQVTLRSVDNNEFVFRSRLRLGERAFRCAAPRTWNSWPSDRDVKRVGTVKTFKKQLKTFLSANITTTFNTFIVYISYVSSWSASAVSCLIQL